MWARWNLHKPFWIQAVHPFLPDKAGQALLDYTDAVWVCNHNEQHQVSAHSYLGDCQMCRAEVRYKRKDLKKKREKSSRKAPEKQWSIKKENDASVTTWKTAKAQFDFGFSCHSEGNENNCCFFLLDEMLQMVLVCRIQILLLISLWISSSAPEEKYARCE